MGVPLVRGLGSGVPLHPLGAARSRVRQEAADLAGARVAPAPEWTDSRLRMGLWRCQPAGAGLGGLARVQDRSETAWHERSGLSGAGVSQAAAELYLVGQPERPRRQERFSRRLFGTG